MTVRDPSKRILFSLALWPLINQNVLSNNVTYQTNCKVVQKSEEIEYLCMWELPCAVSSWLSVLGTVGYISTELRVFTWTFWGLFGGKEGGKFLKSREKTLNSFIWKCTDDLSPAGHRTPGLTPYWWDISVECFVFKVSVISDTVIMEGCLLDSRSAVCSLSQQRFNSKHRHVQQSFVSKSLLDF